MAENFIQKTAIKPLLISSPVGNNIKMKTEIKCPNCKSTFDISDYLEYLKERLIKEISEFIEKIKQGGEENES